MPPLGTEYEQIVLKTTSYTLTVADDVAKFTAAAPATATLPLARTCSLYSKQNVKIIASASTSASDVTIAVGTGDTLVGEGTLSAGETAYITGDGVKTWNSVGASGVTGNSGTSGSSGISGGSGFSGATGFSGFSGRSGFTGISGFSGPSGFSGFSGPSGYTGFTGISGYTGYSGFSGFTGF